LYLCEFIFSSLFVCVNFWQQFLYVRTFGSNSFMWGIHSPGIWYHIIGWPVTNNSEEQCLHLQGCRGHCILLYSCSRLPWPKCDRRKFYCFDDTKKKCWLVECIMGFCKALMGSFRAWLWDNGINPRSFQEQASTNIVILSL